MLSTSRSLTSDIVEDVEERWGIDEDGGQELDIVSTVPTDSNVDQDHQTALLYQENLPTLTFYFCREVTEVARAELGSLCDENTIWKRKETLLGQVKVVRRFQSNLPTLREYFCKEVNEVAKAELDNSRDNGRICRRKETLLERLKVIRKFQSFVDMRPQIWCFLVNTIAAAATGALLNSAHFNDTSRSAHFRIYLGIGLLFMYVVVKMTLLCNEMIAILSIDCIDEKWILAVA